MCRSWFGYRGVIREDGSLIRELVLDPTRDYQPLGTKSGPKPRVVNDVVRHVSTMSDGFKR